MLSPGGGVGVAETAEWADVHIFVPAFVLDSNAGTTGAGDTCAAAFLIALLHGTHPCNAAVMAAAAAACCIESESGVTGMCDWAAVEERLASGWAQADITPAWLDDEAATAWEASGKRWWKGPCPASE